MAYVDTLKVFEILRKKFDEESSDTIAQAIEKAVETNNAALLEKVATKEDLAKVELKIEQVKTELIKWMFILWVGQFASIVGVLTAILFAFFRK